MSVTTGVQYIAVVKGAREVTLAGTADLGYWREQLKAEGLCPCPADDGRAQLLISAVESKWMGVRFRELSVSVFVCEREESLSPDGVFLIGAFNSSRLFAWCERAMLQTPYRHGRIEVQTHPRASFGLLDGPEVVLRAEQSAENTELRESDVVWDVKIFLPTPATRNPTPRKLFYARLSGHTETVAFSPPSDVLTLAPSRSFPEVECLVNSQFVATQWQIRRTATHARSKTFGRMS